jgi:hypothetical protein
MVVLVMLLKSGLFEVRLFVSTGRELEAAGVLNGAQQRFEENQPWNLQVPLVSHDGALVPYAWKRQIAGQAAASAFDRARSFPLLQTYYCTSFAHAKKPVYASTNSLSM